MAFASRCCCRSWLRADGGLRILQWHSWFVALFFGYLAYTSYATLQAYSGRSPW